MPSRHIAAATLPGLFMLLALGAVTAADVRDRAVVSLTFDDLPDATATVTGDSAKAGKLADSIALSGSPARIPSAFVPETAGFSLMLDPDRKQQLVIPSSDDTSRPDAVTISGMFASLHPLSESAYRGLFAKRKAGSGDNSNYGINFKPDGDVLQVYVNDGSGYKAANYSVKATLGFRRRVHLSLAFDTADAAGVDADTDVDDIRARLFINGAVVTPTAVTGGFADGSTALCQ